MKQELPLAFAENLAQNEPALARFEAMSEQEKQAVLESLKAVSSKKEMKQLVARLGAEPSEAKSATDNQWVSTGISESGNSSERRDGPGGE